jgi:hypothetical protein
MPPTGPDDLAIHERRAAVAVVGVPVQFGGQTPVVTTVDDETRARTKRGDGGDRAGTIGAV